MSHIMTLNQPDVVMTPAIVEDILESNENKSVPENIKTSKWATVKAANRRILPRVSQGEIKLSNLLAELHKFTLDEQAEVHKGERIPATNLWDYIQISRQRLRQFLQTPTFQYIVIFIVMIDLIVVLVDLVLGQLSSPCLTEEEMIEYNTTKQRETCFLQHSVQFVHADLFLFYCSAFLLGLFVLEIFISVYAFGWKYFKKVLYLLDGIIVFASFIMELYFHYGNTGRPGRAASAFVIFRLWKIFRAIHAIAHSITLRNHLLIKKIEEAKLILEDEKEQTEQTLEKQEIKLEYFVNILTTVRKLPSTTQVDQYVTDTWKQRKKTA